MIKCDKGQIWVTGEPSQIISECVIILGHAMKVCSELMGCNEINVYNLINKGLLEFEKIKLEEEAFE